MEDIDNKELDALQAELMADAAKADADANIEVANPDELIDASRDGVEEAVLSDTSDADTETTDQDKGDVADLSVNEDEEVKPEEEAETTEEPTQEDTEKAEETKETVSKTKEEKNNDRYDRNWKKFQEEKDTARAEIDSEKEELAKIREELDALKAEQEEAKRPLSSEEYMQLSEHYEKEGQYEDAEKAKANADTRRQQEMQELSTLKNTSKQTQEVDEKLWWENAGKVIQQSSNKDLADASSEIGKRIKGLLDRDPRFMQQEDGFELATHIAEGELASASLTGKDAKIAELTKEINKYKKLTAVGASSANAHPTTPANSTKSIEQEMEDMLKLARIEDARAVV